MRLLSTAMEMLIVEKQNNEKEREQALAERVPPLSLSGLSVQELQVRENKSINGTRGDVTQFFSLVA